MTSFFPPPGAGPRTRTLMGRPPGGPVRGRYARARAAPSDITGAHGRRLTQQQPAA
ncbi:hypothetical protein [Streptomyces eurocidicus]|uniref:Uncharacterized protein n=1 Tax=Streptomyces eurocidicus TaxID=66423 RepID=A0A7W8B9X4_STREU|nr:hypothetical protein [Streptomyces eurocidicus]MBB5118391.1 hypothetical protein [Streptomyces eurocidicus]MBF6051844.1 hypothetical protein [Streptomyces eurocidicus]